MMKNLLKSNNRWEPLTLHDVSKHRAAIYGLAALLIMFCHSSARLPYPILQYPLNLLRQWGGTGVDMFVLLTGFGLYQSLQRGTVREFYGRRAARVALPAVIVTFFFGLMDNLRPIKLAGATALLPFWIGAEGFWYVPYILTMYLIYPLIFRIQQKSPRALWALFAAAEILVAIAYHCFTRQLAHIAMPLIRIPTFILSCILAPCVARGDRVPRWIAPTALVFFLGMSFIPSVDRQSNLYLLFNASMFLSIFLILCFARIAPILNRFGLCRGFYRLLAVLGGISLEIYLLFSRLRGMVKSALPNLSHLNRELMAALLALILSIGLSALCKYLTNQFQSARIPE